MSKDRIIGIGSYRMVSFETLNDINRIKNVVRSRLRSGVNLECNKNASLGFYHEAPITTDAQIMDIVSSEVDRILDSDWRDRGLTKLFVEEFGNDRDKAVLFIFKLIKAEMNLINTMLPVSEEQVQQERENLDALRAEKVEQAYAKDKAKQSQKVDIANAIKEKDIDTLFDLIGEEVFEMRRRDNYPIRPISWDTIAQVYSISSGMVKKIRSHDGYKALVLKAFDNIDQKAIDTGPSKGSGRLWPTSYSKQTLAKVAGYIGELEITPQRMA